MAGKIVSFFRPVLNLLPSFGSGGDGQPPASEEKNLAGAYVNDSGVVKFKPYLAGNANHQVQEETVSAVTIAPAIKKSVSNKPNDFSTTPGEKIEIINGRSFYDGERALTREETARHIAAIAAQKEELAKVKEDQEIALLEKILRSFEKTQPLFAETQEIPVQEDSDMEIGADTVRLPSPEEVEAGNNIFPLKADLHLIQQQQYPEINPEIDTIGYSTTELQNVVFSDRFVNLRIQEDKGAAAETLPPHSLATAENFPSLDFNEAEFDDFTRKEADSLNLTEAMQAEGPENAQLLAAQPQPLDKRDLLIQAAQKLMKQESPANRSKEYNLGRALLLLTGLSSEDAYYASRKITELTAIIGHQSLEAASPVVRKNASILLDKIHEYESFLLTQQVAIAAHTHAERKRQEKILDATRRSMERIAVLMQRSEQPVPSADTPAFDPQHITSTNEAIAALKFQSREVWLWGLIKLSEVVLKEREYNDKFTALDPALAHKKASELAVSNPDLKDLLLRFTEFDPAQDEKSQLFHVQLARNLVTAINPRHKFGKTPVALVKRKPIVRKEPKQGLLAGFKRYVIALFTPAPKKLDWQLRIEQYQKLADEDKNWIRFSQNNAVSLEAGYSSWEEVQAKAKAARAKAIEDRRREAERKLALG